jgi:HEAT repeat protein
MEGKIWDQSDHRLQGWQKAAESCGLQVMSNRRPLEARTELVTVWIETCGDKQRSTQVMVVVPGPPDFTTVRIRPEPLFSWGREIEVGDLHFDTIFFIEGPAPLVFAVLNAETRRLLLRVSTTSHVEISSGSLLARMADEKISDLLPLLVDAGQRLARSMDVPRRLAENAKGDPAPGVRLNNLLLLIRELPGEPETVEAIRAALTDPSPEIRLLAAKELGAEGREVLVGVAESLVDDPVSAEAVSILDRELPFERARAILDQALRTRRLRTAQACLEAIGQRGDATAVGVLEKVMAQEEGELATAAARALGATGGPAAEPWLIQALRREPAGLQVAAANALGRVGSVAAVPLLQEAAERSRLDLELRRATRQAIAEIHSRLPGASRGQLSLAGSEAGQLSLTADPAGQLSLPSREPGQLSLSGPEEERS